MIEIQKKRVDIACVDNSLIKGFISLVENKRVIDILKDHNEDFIVIQEAKIVSLEEVQSFKLSFRSMEEKGSIILNKSAIKWVIES